MTEKIFSGFVISNARYDSIVVMVVLLLCCLPFLCWARVARRAAYMSEKQC